MPKRRCAEPADTPRMDRLKFLCASVILLTIQCIYIKNPSMFSGSIITSPVQEAAWKKFGAYYKLDEHVLFFQTNKFTNESISRFISHVRIKILSPEGAAYGTVVLPRLIDTVTAFNASMITADGNQAPLDVKLLRREYIDKGKVVFPQVVAGCELDLFVESTNHLYYSSYEHWFMRDIPVRMGSFTLKADNACHYATRLYGETAGIKTINGPGPTQRTWVVENLEPIGNQPFSDWPDISQPRVAVAMRNCFIRFEDDESFTSWKTISANIKQYYTYAGHGVFGSRFADVVDQIGNKANGPLEKAKKIVNWVHTNLSPIDKPLTYAELDKTIRDGEGSGWDITCVCNEMLRRAGIQSDVIETRPHSQGGFDSSFVSNSQCYTPLIVATIQNRPYALFPFFGPAAVGEYPVDYFNLQGLNLSTGTIVAIPPPSSSTWEQCDSSWIDAASHEPSLYRDILYSGLAAYTMREKLLNKNDLEIKDYFQALLTQNGCRNKLVSYSIEHLDGEGGSLKVHLTVAFPALSAQKKEAAYYSFTDFFDEFFTGVDSTRLEPFFLPNDIHMKETVSIKPPHGKVVFPRLFCEPFQSSFMKVHCGINAERNSFEREVYINHVRFLRDSLLAHLPELKKLNKIRESSILLR